jgi:pimeloyl-ACP methyl ester carboxylesterase
MTMQSVQTSVLNIAYDVQGSSDGQPIILLHGVPDDIQAWNDVVRVMSGAGYRTYTPYVRGFGSTRFLRDDTIRSGQTGVLAQDLIEFADALGLERFILVGHDWGANAAQAVAALHPARVRHLISFAPYSLTWSDYENGPPNYDQIRALWYQQALKEEMGAAFLQWDRRGFCRYLWETWSPTWQFAAATFETTAVSFDNPDFAAVVLHAYRGGEAGAGLDPRYAAIEAQLAQRPPIIVPTTVLLGRDDGVAIFQPWMAQQQGDFTGGYVVHVVEGVGHFIHRERPEAVVDAIRSVQ